MRSTPHWEAVEAIIVRPPSIRVTQQELPSESLLGLAKSGMIALATTVARPRCLHIATDTLREADLFDCPTVVTLSASEGFAARCSAALSMT